MVVTRADPRSSAEELVHEAQTARGHKRGAQHHEQHKGDEHDTSKETQHVKEEEHGQARKRGRPARGAAPAVSATKHTASKRGHGDNNDDEHGDEEDEHHEPASKQVKFADEPATEEQEDDKKPARGRRRGASATASSKASGRGRVRGKAAKHEPEQQQEKESEDAEAKEHDDKGKVKGEGRHHPRFQSARASGTVLEMGKMFVFYRPKVATEEVESLNDVQRMYLELKPMGAAKDDKQHKIRLLAISRKQLPDPNATERGHRKQIYWAFVDVVADKQEEINEHLQSKTYETKTRGTRTVEPARA